MAWRLNGSGSLIGAALSAAIAIGGTALAVKKHVDEDAVRVQFLQEHITDIHKKVQDLDAAREEHALRLQSIETKVDASLDAVDRLDAYIRGVPRTYRNWPAPPNQAGPP